MHVCNIPILSTGLRPGNDVKAIDDQQAELQNKILDILNGDERTSAAARGQMSAAGVGMAPQGAPPGFGGANRPDPESAGGAPTSINFNNPSVQKALDNLMGTNVLQNISSAVSATSPPPPRDPYARAPVSTPSSAAPYDHPTAAPPEYGGYPGRY